MLVYDTTGSYVTGTGAYALYSNTTGNDNTATGYATLYANTTGVNNTADGFAALYSNTTVDYNTATGYRALYSNQTGSQNTAEGSLTLYSNKGNANSSFGLEALNSNTSGSYNTGVGGFSLLVNSTGSNNVAIGYQAGENLTTGSNNIVIGAGLPGAAGEANTTRIGKTTQAKTLIGGIYDKTVASASGVAVFIDNTGRLGTVKSSARYKDEINAMDKTSEALLKLEPVTFRYKKELDPDGVRKFGLIAEQVEKVNPDLVVRDEDGKVSTVRYEAVNAMLLNEFLKEHAKVGQQQTQITAQQAQIGAEQAQITALDKALRDQAAQQQKEIVQLTATLKEQAAQIQRVSTRLAVEKSTGENESLLPDSLTC